MNKKIKILIVVVVILFSVGVVKNMIIKGAAEGGMKFATGLKLKIQSLNFSVMRSLIDIKNLKLYNPKGFEDKVMVDIPEIYVHVKAASLFSSTVRIKEIRLYLKELMVVKNKDGELNLDSLKVVKEGKEKKGTKKKEESKERTAKSKELIIEKLVLRMDKVIYKDYSASSSPKVKEYPLSLNEQFINVRDFKGVASIILFKAMTNTALAKVTGFDVGNIRNQVSDVLKSSTKIAEETITQTTKQAEVAVQKTSAGLRGVSKELGEAAEEATEGAKKVVGGLKDAFKKISF